MMLFGIINMRVIMSMSEKGGRGSRSSAIMVMAQLLIPLLHLVAHSYGQEQTSE